MFYINNNDITGLHHKATGRGPTSMYATPCRPVHLVMTKGRMLMVCSLMMTWDTPEIVIFVWLSET